jgi:hypothetical protein
MNYLYKAAPAVRLYIDMIMIFIVFSSTKQYIFTHTYLNHHKCIHQEEDLRTYPQF